MKSMKQQSEKLMSILFIFCAAVSVAAVAGMGLYLVVAGIPAIQEIGLVKFLFGQTWQSTAKEPQFGILPFILTTVFGTAGAVVLGVPISLLAAVFLSKFAGKRAAAWFAPAVEVMAAIPSVVYGLIGMQVLVPALMNIFDLSNGTCLLAAILVLTIMILPTMISVTSTALRAVPQRYEAAAMALGATYEEAVVGVSIPAAKSGIAAGIILGIGRAVGEAMAVIMVAGNVPNMPSLFESVTFLTTAIAKEMGYAGGLQRQALFSIALVLFCFIMLLNLLLKRITKKGALHETN